MYIKGDIEELNDWSRRMFSAPEGSLSTQKYSVVEHEGYGYVKATNEAISELDVGGEIVPDIFRLDDDLNESPDTSVTCHRCKLDYEKLNKHLLCLNCEASESQNPQRKKRRGIIDRLVTATQGTQLQDVVMTLRLNYAQQTALFEEGDIAPLAIAVADETDPTLVSYLNISFTNQSGQTMTIKQWILDAVLERGTFILGGVAVDKAHLIDNLTFSRKATRNLNTAMDVYFNYEGNEYGVRFQDWNIFNVMSDAECSDRLQEYIIQNNSIQHPAA